MPTDFWTAKCTRCPAALDRLNDAAVDSKGKTQSVHFVSLCLGDRIDAAREILEEPDVPRWNDLQHYFMDFENKERAKQILQFKTVPYYVVLNQDNDMVHCGTKLDYESIRTNGIQQKVVQRNEEKVVVQALDQQLVINVATMAVNDEELKETLGEEQQPTIENGDVTPMKQTLTRTISPSRVFEIDDLDF
jgi:hypothetical protein